MKWSVKKAAIAGLVVGVIGVLATLTRETQHLSPMYIWMNAVEGLTPVAIFAGVAWIRNLFVVDSNPDKPPTTQKQRVEPHA